MSIQGIPPSSQNRISFKTPQDVDRSERVILDSYAHLNRKMDRLMDRCNETLEISKSIREITKKSNSIQEKDCFLVRCWRGFMAWLKKLCG